LSNNGTASGDSGLKAAWLVSNSPRVRELSDGCLPPRAGLCQDLRG
jgi:hypothetical protein